ncbi:hypothetical protein [Streptomyces collinus]
MVGGQAEVVSDEADDGQSDLAQGQVRTAGFRVVRWQVGFGGVGQSEVSAQDVDAGLAQCTGGGVVGESGQAVGATEILHRGH